MRLARPSILSKLCVFRYVSPALKKTAAKNFTEWVKCHLLEFMHERKISTPALRIVAITHASPENSSGRELLNDASVELEMGCTRCRYYWMYHRLDVPDACTRWACPRDIWMSLRWVCPRMSLRWVCPRGTRGTKQYLDVPDVYLVADRWAHVLRGRYHTPGICT